MNCPATIEVTDHSSARFSPFFDNLDSFAEAPEGVAKLRELILDLAVRGKLVDQDENDEPASAILERCATTRRALVKAKGATARQLESINDDDALYELPSGWAWARLGAITRDFGQKVPDARFTYIDVGTINKEQGIIIDDPKVLNPDEAPSRARKLVARGTVIYATVRPYLLNVAIVDRDFDPEPIVSTAFGILHPLDEISNRFTYYYLRSNPFIEYVEREQTGVAYPAINDGKLFNGPIPLPPLAEQRRIVSKVDNLMSLCDELESRGGERVRLRERASRSCLDRLVSSRSRRELSSAWQRLADHFEILYDTPETLAHLRQSILQLAVQGKLVPQDPNDEPASELLASIQAFKTKSTGKAILKREATLKKPTQDSYAPKAWQTCRLCDLALVEMGNSPPGSSYNEQGDGVPLINGPVEFSSGAFGRTIITKYTTKPSKLCSSGDLLVCVRGATTGRTNIAAFEACIGRGVALVRPYAYPNFLHIFMWWIGSQLLAKGKGTTFPSISYSDLAGLELNCPPLAEQKRIVAKVDELLSQIDELSAQLRDRQSATQQLLTATIDRFLNE